MNESKRKIFTGAQKAKIALEAVRGTKTINEIAQENSVHPTQVSQWKKELLNNVGSLFEGKRGPERSGSAVRQNRAAEYGTGRVIFLIGLTFILGRANVHHVNEIKMIFNFYKSLDNPMTQCFASIRLSNLR